MKRLDIFDPFMRFILTCLFLRHKLLESFQCPSRTCAQVIRSSAAADNGEKEEDDPTSAVVTLTDMNFEAEVIKTDKDVMLEFYAPW